MGAVSLTGGGTVQKHERRKQNSGLGSGVGAKPGTQRSAGYDSTAVIQRRLTASFMVLNFCLGIRVSSKKKLNVFFFHLIY